MNPKCIVLVSGKRKSGKDHLSEHLQGSHFGDTSVIIRLAVPVKRKIAEQFGLDFDRLLSTDLYKEKVRMDMIAMAAERRKDDDGKTFCRDAIAVMSDYDLANPVWIVSDCRSKSDIRFFKAEFKQSIVRNVVV